MTGCAPDRISLHGTDPGVSDATVEAYVRPMVEKAAFAISTNEAWTLLAIVALAGLLLVPFAGKPPQVQATAPGQS